MRTIMTIAAGVAIGYFIYQYFSSSSRHTTNGRIHKSARDRKIAGVLLYFICAFVLPEE